jgi:glycosyltransferase involved in cell wall biosynthesis
MAIRGCRFNVNEDIVTSGDFFCDVIPGVFLKGKNKLTIYTFHIITRKRIVPYLMQQLSILLMRKADKVVVLNTVIKDYLINKGILANRIFVQEVEVDEEAIKKVPNQTKIYEACFMGRLSPSKGIFILPEIWQGMKGKLLVIGGGGFASDVQKLKKLCNENIVFVGHKDGEEKYRLMKQAKIFIHPSYEEGLSLTIKEALACDLPVVAWESPIYKEIYGDRLFTAPVGDIGKFRQKIKEALCGH